MSLGCPCPCLPWHGIVPAGSAFVPLSCLPLFVLLGSSLSLLSFGFVFGVVVVVSFLGFCCLFVCLGLLGCWWFWPTLSCFPPLPSPRACLLVFSGPVSVLLVPPSGYLVVSTTVRLSYLWHGVSGLIGSCLHCASWQQRLRPCVGLCPLHHGVGVVHVPLRSCTEVFALG